MARETKLFIWCDLCLDNENSTTEEKFEHGTEVVFSIDHAKPSKLAFCAEHHAVIVAPLLNALANLGQPVDDKERLKKRAPNIPTTQLKSWTCQDCKHTLDLTKYKKPTMAIAQHNRKHTAAEGELAKA